jgi:hypothetical protein
MNDCDYYEFQALERHLDREQMQVLRSFSSRARITATHFVNEYSFGSFKGDMDEWMTMYFDACIHVAKWGTRVLMFRVPIRLLGMESVQPYASEPESDGEALSVTSRNGYALVRFCSHEDGRWDGSVKTDGVLADLIPIRAELAGGDLRALYLGWLLEIQNGDALDLMEPPVPGGLKSLSPALQGFLDFLEIDRDLVTAAAVQSPDMPSARSDLSGMKNWIKGLPTDEKDSLLLRVSEGHEVHI